LNGFLADILHPLDIRKAFSVQTEKVLLFPEKLPIQMSGKKVMIDAEKGSVEGSCEALPFRYNPSPIRPNGLLLPT